MKTVKVLLGHTMNYSALSSYTFSIEVQNAVVSIQIMKLTIAKAKSPRLRDPQATMGFFRSINTKLDKSTPLS
jgi:hypothetical protein